MAAPLALRSEVTAADLRRQARQTRDANQTRRLLALAAIYEGGWRGDAARIGGAGLQIVRKRRRIGTIDNFYGGTGRFAICREYPWWTLIPTRSTKPCWRCCI